MTVSAQRSSCAKQIFVRCLEALTELQHAWPMALRWEEALRKLAAPINNSPSQTIENPSQMLKVCSSKHIFLFSMVKEALVDKYLGEV